MLRTTSTTVVCMSPHVRLPERGAYKVLTQGVHIRLLLFGNWCVHVPELVNYVTETVL